ncbi:MAG TPA: LLM class F420-dependent oxidoreductase [Pseudonocardiaceae bacterium]|nr:LLM class F420-dependent oxidoreductase [Pseudonocardiaceae bacterium]
MRIGIALSMFAQAPETTNVVDRAIEIGQQAAESGIDTVWFAQLAGYDAISLAALVGRAVPEVRVGTSVVPIHPRHPMLVASNAKTAQAATGGRFQLGLGLGAASVSGRAYGVDYPPPAKNLREYLTALRPLLAGRDEPYEGEIVTWRPFAPTRVAGAEPEIPLLVAAMGPQALRVTGELADGTIPFLAGPRALAEHVVPSITKAAEAAGRPKPRVIGAVPVVVTDKPDEARQRAIEQLAFYDQIPSYRRVLDLEGVEHAGEVFVIGDEESVAAQLRRYVDAGVTEITLSQTNLLGPEAELRTWRLGGELSRTFS